MAFAARCVGATRAAECAGDFGPRSGGADSPRRYAEFLFGTKFERASVGAICIWPGREEYFRDRCVRGIGLRALGSARLEQISTARVAVLVAIVAAGFHSRASCGLVVSDRGGRNCFFDSLDFDSWIDLAAGCGGGEFGISGIWEVGLCGTGKFGEARWLLDRAAACGCRGLRGTGFAFGLDAGIQEPDAAFGSAQPDSAIFCGVHSGRRFVPAGVLSRGALQGVCENELKAKKDGPQRLRGRGKNRAVRKST